jgi:hypothetical protein
MTRKDYVAIAAAIKLARSTNTKPGHQIAVSDVALLIAGVMADDNSRFDRARFLKACGIN